MSACPVPHTTRDAVWLGVGALGGAALSYFMLKKSEKEDKAFPATDWAPGGEVPAPSAFPAYDLSKPKESFAAVGDILIEEACGILPSFYEMPEREVAWIKNMLNYNCKGGKMFRGMMVVESARELWKHQGREIDSDTMNKMCVLGWCIEWMQAWLLVADDFMDSSKTRRGQPCWYLKENVETIALNDAFTIEMLVYKILKRYFVNEPYYLQIVDLFLETTLQTESGQLADTLCLNLQLEDFTVDRWTLIVKYKTSFYSFYLSVALAMVCGGVTDKQAFCGARDILIKMGVYFQAQDDFMDCFADPAVLGKIGTDIQDKKCGWLFAHAYHHLCNDEQKSLLDTHYGKCAVGSDEEKAIKKMYAELGLEAKYHAYEEKSAQECRAMMDNCHAAIPKEMFEIFLKKIFKRSK